MVAAKIATMKHGGDRKGESFKAPIGALKCGAVSQRQAAKKLNVSRRNVQRATIVRTHGVPELQHAVETGEVPKPQLGLWQHPNDKPPSGPRQSRRASSR
jgi:hypothetical protein